LENARAAVEQLEAKLKSAQDKKVKDDAEKDLQSARNKVENLEKTMALYKSVGVWTDDFSNLIRVFRLKEDYDTDD
jgi:multidrug resistance efflux pump